MEASRNVSRCQRDFRAMSEDDPPSPVQIPHTGPTLNNFYNDVWTWNKRDKSHEVRLHEDCMTAHFHPNWSNGTAGVRGTRRLNRGGYYWEIHVSQRIFGTSMMFGIGTKKARLHTNVFVNMLGEDNQGWGLSHKGLLWHNGKFRQYAKPFRENEATTIGLLFDGLKGTLSYYKDGCNLGVAFTDLHLVQDDLYPILCSTAAKTEMTLGSTKRAFYDLQDQCRVAILKRLRTVEDVRRLRLPNILKEYIEDGPVDLIPRRKEISKCSPRHRYCLRSKSCGPHKKNIKSVPYSEDNCRYYS